MIDLERMRWQFVGVGARAFRGSPYRYADCAIEALCREVEEMRGEHDTCRQNRKELFAHVLQLQQERDELRQERDELQLEVDGWRMAAACKNGPYIGSLSDWLPAPDSKPPELADAQMVTVRDQNGIPMHDVAAAAEIAWGRWEIYYEYRPLYSASGLPLCSPEGLEPKTTHVAKDELGMLWQFQVRPTPLNVDGVMRWCESSDPRTIRVVAPESHRKPGLWSESIMEVMR